MKNVTQLKQQLIDIRNNNWSIPDDTDKYELALEMLENIGSIDVIMWIKGYLKENLDKLYNHNL